MSIYSKNKSQPTAHALRVARQFVQVVDVTQGKDVKWAVTVGGKEPEGVCEFFEDERTANHIALTVIYELAHAIDILIAKVTQVAPTGEPAQGA